MKILIIGAGPTGLTAALEFARQGVMVEIVDAKAGPSQLSRAVGILPNSIKILSASGASSDILDEGVKFNTVKMHYNGKAVFQLDMSHILGQESLPILLPQDRTETLMSEALAKLGVTVEYNQRVVDIHTNNKKATVTFAGGASSEYDWVVAADGVKSTVREKLGIEYSGYELSETWSIADVELEEEIDASLFSLWVIDGTYRDIFVIAPLGPKRVRLVSSTPDSLQALPIELNIKNVRRERSFKISIRQAESYVQGRVLLAGDAAHTHSPVGGRGMNLGIDDAAEAVKAILEGKTDAYSNQRRKIGARVISETEKMRKTLVSSNPVIILLLRYVFFLIRHISPLKKLVAQKMTRL